MTCIKRHSLFFFFSIEEQTFPLSSTDFNRTFTQKSKVLINDYFFKYFFVIFVSDYNTRCDSTLFKRLGGKPPLIFPKSNVFDLIVGIWRKICMEMFLHWNRFICKKNPKSTTFVQFTAHKTLNWLKPHLFTDWKHLWLFPGRSTEPNLLRKGMW